MAKTVLNFDYKLEFVLVAIGCHLKDYRIAGEINKLLIIELAKQDDYILSLKKDEKDKSFSKYHFEDEDNQWEYYLLSNKSNNGFLIPELKQIDYLLQIHGNLNFAEAEQIVKEIKTIPIINVAYLVDVDKLKSRDNLIF